MISILTWVSIFAGGLLVLLLLISILSGLELEVDVGSTEGDIDSGGLGVIKGVLTFVSVSSWVVKVMLTTQSNAFLAAIIGIISGIAAFMLLSYLFKLLLNNEQYVNWKLEDALFCEGVVYLRIPPKGSGIVNVEVKGAMRELKAKSNSKNEIGTGATVYVREVEGDFVIVEKTKNH